MPPDAEAELTTVSSQVGDRNYVALGAENVSDTLFVTDCGTVGTLFTRASLALLRLMVMLAVWTGPASRCP